MNNNDLPLCPLDKSQMRLWLNVPGDSKRPSEKTSYNTYWCDKCQYGILHPRPSSEEIASFYKLEDESYYTHEIVNNNVETKYNLIHKLLLNIAWRFDNGQNISGELISNLVNKKGVVCDIGCGSGNLLLQCQKFGHSTIGIEPDSMARAAATSKGLLVKEGTVENLPIDIKNESFDVVIMNHSLEHVLDVNLALKNIFLLLKSGGFFVCEVPNNQCLGAILAGNSWFHLAVPRHLNFFTEKSLMMFLEKAGFKFFSKQYSGYCRQFTKEYIELEQEAYDFSFFRDKKDFLPVKPSIYTRWFLLAKSCLASPRYKFDSFRLVFQKT